MNIEKLAALSFWTDWQKHVERSLPNICGDSIFCHQTMDKSNYEAVAKRVAEQQIIYDVNGKEKDATLGAAPFLIDTQACGRVSRMWLDTNREITFLKKHFDLSALSIIDIGAGYGRLATVLSKEVRHYSTVDSVEIAASSCRYYCNLHKVPVNVMNLTDMLMQHSAGVLPNYNLAINIHSWSECDAAGVKAWLDTLRELKVGYLFTVMHTHDYIAYNSSDNLKHLFEQYYTHLDHCADGIVNSPYDLWKLKL